ncbi:MAG: Ig-like domain-containing protein [Dehalococcoidia bacterium]
MTTVSARPTRTTPSRPRRAHAAFARLVIAGIALALGLPLLGGSTLGQAATGRPAVAGAVSAPPALLAPTITAVKSAALAPGGDLNTNGVVNPGDTLRYTVTLTNTAAPGAGNDALGTVFTDVLNAGLTLVPGSVKATPIAVNDAYAAVGNMGISVPAGSGLLANDLDPNGDTLTITSPPATTANGGALSITATTGAFTYDPPVGFIGSDSFTYTVSDGNGGTDTATVTITVSNIVWFVNNTAGACPGAPCDGRLSHPFTNVSALHAVNNGAGGATRAAGSNPGPNDPIVVDGGSGNYAGPLTLLSGQKLIGEGATATLASITGITLPTFSVAFPTTGGTRPTIAHTATNVTLSTSNLVRG